MALEGEPTSRWEASELFGLDPFKRFEAMVQRLEHMEGVAKTEVVAEPKLSWSEEESFGELRSIMQRSVLDDAAMRELEALTRYAARSYPEDYAARWVDYIRGFPSHLRTLTAPTLHTRVPCVSFHIHSGTRVYRECIASGHTSWWTSLTLFSSHKDGLLSSLMGAPVFEHLVRIKLFGARAEELERLGAMPHFGAVHTLTLEQCALSDARILHALLTSGVLRGVRTLCVLNCHLDSASLATLLNSGALKGLERLDLGGNPLGVRGARVLAASTTLPKLRDLSVCDAGFGDQGLTALSRSSHLEALESLSVTKDDILDGGIWALVHSPLGRRLRRLELLDLQDNELFKCTIKALAELPRLEDPWRASFAHRAERTLDCSRVERVVCKALRKLSPLAQRFAPPPVAPR